MTIREIVTGKLQEFLLPAAKHGLCTIDRVVHLGNAKFEITGKCCKCNESKTVRI